MGLVHHIKFTNRKLMENYPAEGLLLALQVLLAVAVVAAVILLVLHARAGRQGQGQCCVAVGGRGPRAGVQYPGKC